MHFDDKATRTRRLKDDKYALFSEIWDRFIENAQSCYKPGPNITIDEQLFPTKARCPFTQFMPKKPDKYGQKFLLAVDNDSKYLVNAMPYLGKNDLRPTNLRLGDYFVLTLMKPYLKKGKNVTCDNFFTFIFLAEGLAKDRTSLVGTVNRKRKEVPEAVKIAKENLYSTQVMKSGSATMTVYQCKPNRNVIIMSTMHPDVQLNKGDKKKPEMVEFYNETKPGVDVVDQMARKYSTKASSRRWPMHAFYNVLDLALINASVLYKEVLKINISRRDFILKLGTELAKENVQARGRLIGDENDGAVAAPGGATDLRRCQVKASCTNGRSPNACEICKQIVCKKCVGRKSVVCVKCTL